MVIPFVSAHCVLCPAYLKPSQELAQEYTPILFYVFGGCCTNAFSLEYVCPSLWIFSSDDPPPHRALLKDNPALGSALTFSQLLFIALEALPSFLTFTSWWMPRLKPRHVPLSTWLVQVLLLTLVSLLNNGAFRFHVPLALQILIRSAGKRA